MMDMNNSTTMTGVSSSGSMQGTMDMGTSSGGVLSGLLSTVTELLFVVLILSLVVGLAVWLKNTYFKESYNKGKQIISNDPMLKMIFVLASTLVGVIVILYLLGILMNGGVNSNQIGFVSAWSVSGILTFFVKILTILFVGALIGFLFTYVKQNMSSAAGNGALLTAVNETKSSENVELKKSPEGTQDKLE
ncbi:hypothetical protein [Paenibacillus ihuae]|uniref:hypothetical protein n=1 Tax=Paenibacillus ihuae TaxID=1232431 RepID=UPI0006D533F7|nr:hypothetical protein [Paenibacillus ihuae]